MCLATVIDIPGFHNLARNFLQYKTFFAIYLASSSQDSAADGSLPPYLIKRPLALLVVFMQCRVLHKGDIPRALDQAVQSPCMASVCVLPLTRRALVTPLHTDRASRGSSKLVLCIAQGCCEPLMSLQWCALARQLPQLKSLSLLPLS